MRGELFFKRISDKVLMNVDSVISEIYFTIVSDEERESDSL